MAAVEPAETDIVTVLARSKRRWDTADYRRVVAADYDVEADQRTVDYADGSRVCLATAATSHPLLDQPDWSAVAAGPFEIRIPTPTGDFELPWDRIRALTDPAFRDHLDGIAAEVSRQTGMRLRSLRAERGMSVTDLADRAGVSEATLARIEAGQEEASLDEFETLLAPLGRSLDVLVDDR